MSPLPAPPEPDEATLERYAEKYESGVSNFLGGVDVDREKMYKQALIGYFDDEWSHHEITHNEIKAAIGSANAPISHRVNGKADWEEVIGRIESALDQELSK